MSVFEKVKEMITKTLNVDAEKITMEAVLADDLGADSLDAVELIMDLEDEFGVSFDDDSMQSIKTVADLVNYIEKK